MTIYGSRVPREPDDPRYEPAQQVPPRQQYPQQPVYPQQAWYPQQPTYPQQPYSQQPPYQGPDPPAGKGASGDRSDRGIWKFLGRVSLVITVISGGLGLASQLGAFGNFRIPFLPGVAVSATISVDASRGPSGTPVTVTGQHFAGGEAVTVRFDVTEIARGQADKDGAVSLTATIPADYDVFGERQHEIIVTGGSSAKSATWPFLLTIGPGSQANAALSLDRGSGPSGTKVVVSGSGFGHGDTVEIRFEVDQVGQVQAVGAGKFSTTVTIPGTYDAFGPGQHTITATGRPSIRSASAPFMLTR